jgi:hypothetical protein
MLCLQPTQYRSRIQGNFLLSWIHFGILILDILPHAARMVAENVRRRTELAEVHVRLQSTPRYSRVLSRSCCDIRL